MIEDAQLLGRYVTERSQDAFAELVRRRVNMVYSVALRQVGGDTHLAEDVTQKVFADLARKASSLRDRPVLSGWLYRSAQFAASDMVRSERRRRGREQETYAMQELTQSPEAPTDWDRIRPLLDEAMSDLNEPDRDAVALRFFEGRAFAEIGHALRLTEEAARKRVERALDKLAAALSRRGVTSTSAAIGVALAGQAAVSAPAGFAAAVSGAVLAGAGAVAAGSGMLAFMASTGVTIGVAGVAALAVGAAVYENTHARTRDAELAALTEQHARVQSQLSQTLRQLQLTAQRLDATQARATAAEEDNAKLLSAIETHRASLAAASAGTKTNLTEPLTHDAVQARYRRAQELARSGDLAEALRELLWCFDTGMPPIAGFGGVRMSFLLSDIARLGERYPAALAALRERRDKAEQRLLASGTDYDATSTFAGINRYLKDNARTLAVFDQLPTDDRRRRTLAMSAFDELLEMRRYQDAALGKTFVQMTQQFDRSAEERPLPPGITDPTRVRKAERDYLISSTAKHVEVLAGAGNLDQARTLAAKLLAYDASADTRAVLQRHAERAGHPELLGVPPKG